MNKERHAMNRKAIISVFVALAFLTGAKDGCGHEVSNQDNSVRTDPNPHQPKPPAPPKQTTRNRECSYRVDIQWEDIPSGVNWHGWAGSGNGEISGDPSFEGNHSIHLGVQPDGILLNGIVKATAPELTVPKGFKPHMQLTIYGLNITSGDGEFVLSGPTKTRDRGTLTINSRAKCK